MSLFRRGQFWYFTVQIDGVVYYRSTGQKEEKTARSVYNEVLDLRDHIDEAVRIGADATPARRALEIALSKSRCREIRLPQAGRHDEAQIPKDGEVWAALLRYWGHACAYCRKRFPEDPTGAAYRDHVIPQSQGGSNGPENVVPCCKSCSAGKADRPVYVWLALQPAGRTRGPLVDLPTFMTKLKAVIPWLGMLGIATDYLRRCLQVSKKQKWQS